MDDLISRAAAIEAIEPLLYSGDFVSTLSTLIHLPAVGAVPVEWLEEHDGVDIRDIDGNIFARRRITVVEALSMWQKKQEVQK